MSAPAEQKPIIVSLKDESDLVNKLSMSEAYLPVVLVKYQSLAIVLSLGFAKSCILVATPGVVHCLGWDKTYISHWTLCNDS